MGTGQDQRLFWKQVLIPEGVVAVQLCSQVRVASGERDQVRRHKGQEKRTSK